MPEADNTTCLDETKSQLVSLNARTFFRPESPFCVSRGLWTGTAPTLKPPEAKPLNRAFAEVLERRETLNLTEALNCLNLKSKFKNT